MTTRALVGESAKATRVGGTADKIGPKNGTISRAPVMTAKVKAYSMPRAERPIQVRMATRTIAAICPMIHPEARSPGGYPPKLTGPLYDLLDSCGEVKICGPGSRAAEARIPLAKILDVLLDAAGHAGGLSQKVFALSQNHRQDDVA